MKLLRVGQPGRERPAAYVDGQIFDLSAVVPDLDADCLAGGGLDRIRAALAGDELPELAADGLRVGAPIARPGKVVCIGLNYSDHAEETGATPPAEPVLFMKDPYTVVGPDDEVLVPRGSSKTDYEVELAVVIGSKARYLPDEAAALECIAGYAVANDVSEREFQLERGGTWDKGKSAETFNPLGPWLVTADEVPDPQQLDLTLSVNGEVRQQGTTAKMIFGVAEVVRYLSQFMVLMPGDVINTGTPAGVAMGFPEPKPYLRGGDRVELSITGLGTQTQHVGQA